MADQVESSPLGKTSSYIDQYEASLLFPIQRQIKRDEINIPRPIPFYGFDVWNAYEVSWLNKKGKPIVAIARFEIPCESTCIIESKSFKLYLNSFNQTQFDSVDAVTDCLKRDLSVAVGCEIKVEVIDCANLSAGKLSGFEGVLLDELDVGCSQYTVDADLLVSGSEIVDEVLCSNLLKSNCLVTGQPDWGSVQIAYRGRQIDRAALLQYIVSFRQHNEFHEQCVERIYMDIMRTCQPEHLMVYARYTRRGGLDINPLRASYPVESVSNHRQFRQ